MKQSLVKVKKALSLLLIVFIVIFISCSSTNILKGEKINTKKQLSSGYKSGDNIYFLCNYVISTPGKTIIPMYMYRPGKNFFNSLYLYSFNITEEKLSRIAELNSLASDPGKPDIQFSLWAMDGPVIYMMYNSGWNKSEKKLAWNFFKYIPASNITEEVKGEAKSKLIKQFFPGNNLNPVSKKNTVSLSRVWYYVGVLPEDTWQLPSPVSFADMNEKKYVKVLIEGLNDRYFREAAFIKLKPSLSREQLLDIITSMEKKFNKLSDYEKMQYRNYMEEWSSRIYIEAKFIMKTANRENIGLEESIFRNEINKVKDLLAKNTDINKADVYGLTPLMIASYANNSDIADELIKQGADLNAQDKNGCTPLMYAIFGKSHRTMELLIKKGADLKKKSGSGWVAWMFVSDTRLRQRFIKAAGL